MKLRALGAVLLLAVLGSAAAGADPPGPQLQAFIDRVTFAPAAERTALVDSFMGAVPGFPFIEGTIAEFIYRGSAATVTVPGDANGWDMNAFPMTRLSTTDFWYLAEAFEADARLDYKFVLNGSSWILDPRNPRQVSGGFGPNSELAMPQYVQPWEIGYRAGIPHGRLESKSVYSVIRAVAYTVQVYLPPGYDASGLSYPVAYFHDGGDYLNLGSTVNIIDNLLDSGKIAPLIAVFVTPTNRNEEYAYGARTSYRLFVVSELVPAVDGLYRTLPSPAGRATIGDSFGGNISALISYYHPAVFGLCGLHSGAFWPNGYEADSLIASGPLRVDSIRYAAVWGSYEGSLTANMRAFTARLRQAGYDISARELHEGHSWGQWRATTDELLEHLFPPAPAGAVTGYEGVGAAFTLEQNYPNPFNPSTTIRYTLTTASPVRLAVFNTLGEEVALLASGFRHAGGYSVTFGGEGLPSGVYYCRLAAGGTVLARKLLLLR